MNIRPDQKKPARLRELFHEAEKYANLVVESLILERESTVHVDPYVARHAFEHRGFPKSWEWTPRMVMELRRNAHVVHFLFPNLTDHERTLLIALWDACHRLRVYRLGSNDSTFLGYERWLATRQAGQCEEDYHQCRQAIEEADIDRKLTTVQLDVLATNYFAPDSTLKVESLLM